MGKTAVAPKKAAKKAVAKKAPKKKEAKEFVVSIRMDSDTNWARPMRMREADRIRRNSSLEMNVFSQVVYMSLQQLRARIADNALLEALRAERVKLVEQLVERSREVYGDKGKADRWMLRPSAYLGNKAPVEKLGSMAGIAEVMTELERIDASAFA